MLEARNLTVAYGRHRALEDVSIRVDRGEICVILGANGAGKSTLLKTIAGIVRPTPGAEIKVDGRAITGWKPSRIVEAGIALVPEGRGIFPELSVRENLELGAYAVRARPTERDALERVYALFPKLAERRRQIVRTMSGGEQQMVAIGRALMSNPDILMLDEPSLGLSPILSASLFGTLAEIGRSGVGILLVEQNARQSLKIADRGYLLENGHILSEASAASLVRDPAVVHAYLGGTARARFAFELPAAAVLAENDAGELARLAEALAVRAGTIRSAWQHALRKAAPLPSAFVGRYDKDADPGPPAVRPASRRPASPDAAAIAASAADLARRATDRLAAHLITQRLSSRIPSAFMTGPRYAAAPGEPRFAAVAVAGEAEPASAAEGGAQPAGDLSRLAESLAARAADVEAARRHASRATRRSSGTGDDGTAAEPAPGVLRSGAGPRDDGVGNGAGPPRAPDRAFRGNGPDIGAMARDLAERAARRQAEYLAERRAGGTGRRRDPKSKGA